MSWRAAVLLLACSACLIACPSGDDDDSSAGEDPTPEEPFDPSLYEVLEYDLTEKDGEAYKGVEDSETVFHVQRFRTDTPLRVVAIGAMFNVRGDDDSPAHLAIYPDEGHNFFDFLRETPLVEFELSLNKDEHDEVWQVLPLDEPIDFPHPQLVYVGSHYRGEPGQPVLALDEDLSIDPFLAAHAGENDQYPPYVAVLPDRGTNSGGFETVMFGGGDIGSGDLMVRLYVERYDVVADGETWFRDATEDPSIGLPGSGAVAFVDCNDDGWVDVFDGRLRVNNGDGTFTDLTDSSGIDSSGSATFGDYNNDGAIDLFMATTSDQLYEGQGDCVFVNVTAASGIDDTQPFDTGEGLVDQQVPTVAASWVDFDGDGLLDLVQPNFGSFATEDYAIDRLWHNQGDGLFVDISESAGIVQGQGSGKAGRGSAPADWDGDGDMDLYVSNYRLHRNFAWSNNGDLTFTDVGRENWLEGHADSYGGGLLYYYGHTIGSAWGDVDNDGDLDLFAANLAHPRFITFSDKSMFLRNELVETGEASFTNLREEAGMLYQETDSSPVFLDFDNDGLLDLFYTAVYPARPSYLYRNEGDFTFSMVSYPAGTWIYNGWGVSAADTDNDGDVDLYGGRFLVNEHEATGGWLKVRAVGGGTGQTNRSGVGAKIHVTTDSQTVFREVAVGVGVGCQQPLEQHFGLGDASSATVEVEFPVTGTVISVGSTPSGTRLVVHEDGTIESH